jgi:hypothetical protein
MAEKTLKRMGMGYVIGMPVGTLILVFLSYATEGGALLFTDALLQRVGSEASALLVQTMLSGIIGAVGMGATSFFDIEGWSVLKSALAYYATYTIAFLPIGFFLGWLEGPADALVMAEIFALVEFSITLAMTVHYRVQVRNLNALLEESRQGSLHAGVR